jgi:ubiquinol-cytochrome c reductase iron-sulfur subunit
MTKKTTKTVKKAPANKSVKQVQGETPADPQRRDFMVLSATAMACVGAAAVAVPLVSSMNPSAEVKAQSSIEVDISNISVGQEIKVKWRGKPVFIKRRTAEEIAEAREVLMSDLPDPEQDSARVKAGKAEWLVMVGICTHLGCVPLPDAGDYDGWFCPCHGSHYDSSGRVRKGPAPKNLAVPAYEFINENTIKIG